jgi:hypothetical protein
MQFMDRTMVAVAVIGLVGLIVVGAIYNWSGDLQAPSDQQGRQEQHFFSEQEKQRGVADSAINALEVKCDKLTREGARYPSSVVFLDNRSELLTRLREHFDPSSNIELRPTRGELKTHISDSSVERGTALLTLQFTELNQFGNRVPMSVTCAILRDGSVTIISRNPRLAVRSSSLASTAQIILQH